MGEDAHEYASASVTARYSYRAFTDVEITRDFILAWLGSAAAALVLIRGHLEEYVDLRFPRSA